MNGWFLLIYGSYVSQNHLQGTHAVVLRIIRQHTPYNTFTVNLGQPTNTISLEDMGVTKSQITR